MNENDNNKNRKYEEVDRRVSETYGRDSAATNKNALSDPYVKAFRWASDRIGEEGIVAFVSNGSYLTDLAFDGMRGHLRRDFDAIYVLDLGGNVRKNPKLSGTTHNVFGIQVGVCIAFLVRRGKADGPRDGQIFYAAVERDWRKEQKYDYLDVQRDLMTVAWRELTPDARHTWLTEGLRADFATFPPMGTKAAKAGLHAEAIFANYGRGVATSRDAWVYNFRRDALEANVRRMMAVYNDHVLRWQHLTPKPPLDDFVEDDPTKVTWGRELKSNVARGRLAEYDTSRVRRAVYRPFTQQWLYFDRLLNEMTYQMPSVFPSSDTDNALIWVTDKGSEKPFMALATDELGDLHLVGAGSSAQCFPFYVFDESGTIRVENITDWALAQFGDHYGDESITKRDIFHYVYAVLHHPEYRRKYAADLKRDLPRIPFAPDFRAFAVAGEKLAALHVGYEEKPEYPLRWVESPDVPLDWRVAGGMRFSRDKTQIVYNDFLTLDGVPAAAFDYRLGHRSALEWVVDQYRVTTDRRSGIVNDPNRPDDPPYIARLVGKVITVSLETNRLVAGLPGLE